MARTTRTTKRLAQRIDLSYFKRPSPFRRWRFLLSVGVPVVALVWVLVLAVAGRRQVYSSGPLSRAHAVFGAQCGVCHLAQIGGFQQQVGDKACLTCHDGPVHQSTQKFAPACASCHTEHRGPVRLAHVSDVSCAQCHANLQTKSGAPRVERDVRNFNSAHPEFAAVRAKSDPGAIKLNHRVHLKAGLAGPGGKVQMDCADCHRPAGSAQPWPYGGGELHKASALTSMTVQPAAPDLRPRTPVGRYMAPPTYASNCAGCHKLEFDKRFTEQVPHDKPEIVREFVVKKFREYIAQHPGEIRQPSAPARRLPTEPVRPAPRNADEWVAQRVADAETLLWRKTCLECHTLNATPEGLPKVAPAKITPVWMPHAAFDHQPHRLLDCAACHTPVANSQETSDLLLPGISTCQQCHRSGDAAENRCFLCHTYHDWRQARPTKGKYALPELLRGKGQ